MIKINRSKCPDVLRDSPSEGIHYNKEQVVQALWEMQHGKCCYCEQKLPSEGHLKTVEHFHPQSVFKGLKNDWKNLLLACAQCNGKKSDKFPVELTSDFGKPKVVYLKLESNGESLLIDPSDPEIDPEEHITFIVDDVDDNYGIITVKNNSKLGRYTIDVIDLKNEYYTRKRRDLYVRTLMVFFWNLLSAKEKDDESILQSYKDQFKILMSAKGEFAAFVRAYARYKQLDRRFEISIPVGAET